MSEVPERREQEAAIRGVLPWSKKPSASETQNSEITGEYVVNRKWGLRFPSFRDAGALWGAPAGGEKISTLLQNLPTQKWQGEDEKG